MANAIAPFDQKQVFAAGKNTGWQTPNAVIYNPDAGVYVIRVVNQNPEGKITYDQILRAEQGGGVFLPITKDGKYGLQKRIRPQTRDQKAYAKFFAEQVKKGNHAGVVDMDLLGRPSYECPRGYSKLGESGQAAAIREAQEEAQGAVIEDHDLGYQCDNTAYSPHLTATRWGKIDLSKKPIDKPDPDEPLLKVEWFDINGLRKLQENGELYCSYTLGAIGKFLISLNSMTMF